MINIDKIQKEAAATANNAGYCCICGSNQHRMEYRMIGGNPVERHYDNFCRRYNGKKIMLTDVFKDRYGKYHDMAIYEIIFDKE